MAETFGSLYILLIIFLLILAILWFILPFAIFGIKPLLNKLLAELEETNRYLSKLVEEQREENDTNQEQGETHISIDYLAMFCSKCVHFQEQTGACKKFSVNVRDYPEKFLEKCDGTFFEHDGKIHFLCDKCGTKFVATKEQDGKSGECNNCGAPIIVRV